MRKYLTVSVSESNLWSKEQRPRLPEAVLCIWYFKHLSLAKQKVIYLECKAEIFLIMVYDVI